MKKLGKNPRRHDFFLNPYQDWRFSSCPQCGEKNRERKFPLVIHVEPLNAVALNKSCRHCPPCDLIIAHRDEIEMQQDLPIAPDQGTTRHQGSSGAAN
jgi:hypothetical protein